MKTRILLLTVLSATLAACSSVPDRNIALDDARARYTAAQNDPQVAALAPTELKLAGDSLRVAEQSWSDRAVPATVDHLAYLTTQRVTIARETASSKASQAITAGAAAERDKMRLAVRTSEANVAQRQLAVADAQLAAADAEVLREKARIGTLEAQLRELNAKQTDRGMVVTLGDVLFESGQSRLLAEGARNVAKLADFLKRNPQQAVLIEGYTDNVGSAASNFELSEQRANAVKLALLNMGVPVERLRIRAHGEDDPTASNGTAAGRQMNRRVEIVFSPQRDGISLR